MTSARARLEARVAKLFSVGFHGQALGPELDGLLARGVGGVIFFARNVGEPAEVRALCAELKRRAARPLLLSVDQEGGPVARLRRGFTALPPMRAVGAAGSVELARELGAVVGRELRAVGFDLDFAPVLDVDTNPNNPVIGARAFAREAERVSELALAFAAGLADAGVAACGKHFPGHGDTSADSHLELPRLEHPRARLDEVELAPFRAAVNARLPALMTSHVIFEAVDAEQPATMSRPVIHGILRQELGYDGLVVSDDLEMSAIAAHYGAERAVIAGLNAGVDHFLCCHSAELAHRLIDAVLRALENGDVSETSLAQAERRYDALTQRYARAVDESAQGLDVLQSEAHIALVMRLCSLIAPRAADVGVDPTAIMERLRRDREHRLESNP